MHEEQNKGAETSDGSSEEADRAIADLPDQLARARAVVRQAREQLSVHMASDRTDEGG